MLLDLLQRRHSSNLEDPNVPLSGRNVADYIEGRQLSTSGLAIGSNEALTYSPVWSAVDMISSDIARIPWKAYRDGEAGKSREELRNHPVWGILRRRVAMNETTNIWLVRMLAHALLHGNAFSVIRLAGRDIDSLEFIHSNKVTVQRVNGTVYYEVNWDPYTDDRDRVEKIAASSMFHLQGLTLDYYGGLSLVKYARNMIGRQLSAEVYGSDFFKNSAVPQGYFSHPGKMSEPAQERLVSQFEKRFGSAGLRHRIGVLEEGMTWVATAVSPEDAMLIETMKWGVPEVARFFGIPPHKLGDANTKGWNTTEQENRSYYNSTLGKWVDRLVWESIKLFREDEQKTTYTAFDLDGWFQANTLDRYTANGIAIQWGWKTRNEVRAQENLNPLEGLDDPLTPLNMVKGDEPPPSGNGNPAAEPADEEQDMEEMEPMPARDTEQLIALRDLLIDQLGLMNKRLCRMGTKVNPKGFLKWINQLDDDHGDVIRDAFRPAARMIAATQGRDAENILESISNLYISECRDRFLTAAEDPADMLEGNLLKALEGLQEFSRSLSATIIIGSNGHGKTDDLLPGAGTT